MDLGAYAQIEDIEKIAKVNGIEVPRLRGYRLMRDEEPEDYSDILKDVEVRCVKDLCEAVPFWSLNAKWSESSDYTDYLKYYFLKSKNGMYTEVRWERIHGWKRRRLKLAVHNLKKKIKNQYDTFNKYAGRDDILYIHSRIGGNNWPMYAHDVVGQPWFIEKVDDYFDSTYCDIYARIKVE